MKIRVFLLCFLMSLLCTCVVGCLGSPSPVESSDKRETATFICDLELKPNDKDMAFYKYGGSGEYAEMEYDEVPEEATNIKSIDNPLSTEVLYEYLQAYVNSNDFFVYLPDDNVCRITYYKYEYILMGTQGDYYFIPVIRFSIKDYGDVYMDVENGCVIY